MARHKIQQKIDANGTVVDLDIEAERASKDGNGDVIANTYVKDVKIGNTSVVNSSRIAQFEELTNAEIDEICSGAGSNPSGLDTMLLNKLYPVGSIYTSVNNVSPASFLGGNWERIQDKFLLAGGSTYTPGATGGAATHSHNLGNGYAKITREFASDSIYSVEKVVDYYAAGRVVGVEANSYAGGVNKAVVLGGDTNNADSMPPYLSVYVWKRLPD